MSPISAKEVAARTVHPGLPSWTNWYEYAVPETDEPSIVKVSYGGHDNVPIRTIPGKTMWWERHLIGAGKLLVVQRWFRAPVDDG